jgi:hypothetical protein
VIRAWQKKKSLTITFALGFTPFGGERRANSRPEVGDCRRERFKSCPFECKFRVKDGGAVMKFLFLLKDKMTPEKSLKAYAWYHWY